MGWGRVEGCTALALSQLWYSPHSFWVFHQIFAG